MTHSIVFDNVTAHYQNDQSNKEIKKKNVLENINFTAESGDIIGIIGTDSDSKYALANLIAGSQAADEGEITINGKPAFIFGHDDTLKERLTGRENIELNLFHLGYNKEEMNDVLPEIITLAGIRDKLDEPVGNYLEQMKNRLHFALTLRERPDILVIDETILDKDESFAAAYRNEIDRLAKKGKTIFLISQSMEQVREVCQTALWLEAGEVAAYDEAKAVLLEYERFLNPPVEKEPEAPMEIDSQADEQTAELEKTPYHRTAATGGSRAIRNRQLFSGKVIRNTIIAFLIMMAVIAGFTYLQRNGLADKPATSEILGSSKDIRYVTVQSATVREKAEFGSNIVGTANFGGAFQVHEKQDSSAASVKWLKVEGITTDLEGWMSNKFLEKVQEEVDDNEVAEAVDGLIRFTPSLEKAIPMIGKKKEQVEAFDYTEYMYAEDTVKGFTITLNDSSNRTLKEVLGAPQLKRGNQLLYHGAKYDFLFTLQKGGTIETLTVVEN